jgi:hypothetical protein
MKYDLNNRCTLLTMKTMWQLIKLRERWWWWWWWWGDTPFTLVEMSSLPSLHNSWLILIKPYTIWYSPLILSFISCLSFDFQYSTHVSPHKGCFFPNLHVGPLSVNSPIFVWFYIILFTVSFPPLLLFHSLTLFFSILIPHIAFPGYFHISSSPSSFLPGSYCCLSSLRSLLTHIGLAKISPCPTYSYI